MTAFLTQAERAVPLGLFAVALFTGQCVQSQSPNNREYREIRVEGRGAQPAMSLGIRAEGREGLVSVRDSKGNELQSLSCTLLREHLKPTQEEWAGAREQFVKQFLLEDFDSDGFTDLAGVREYGAKWARYCVWLYDPKQHLFVKDFLAEQMELLSNLSKAGNGVVSSASIGPTNPWIAEYKIVAAVGARPERQLMALSSCLVETAPDGSPARAVVSTRYEGAKVVVERQAADGIDSAKAMRKCRAGG